MRRTLVLILVYGAIGGVFNNLYSQPATKLYGSGIEIHLLIDCSESVWQRGDPNELKKCFKQILAQVVSNIRPIEENGDRLAVYFFADRLKVGMPLQIVGHEDATQKAVSELLQSVLLQKDTPMVDGLSKTKSDLRTVLAEVYDKIESTALTTRVEQTKVVIIISDGIHDPKNEFKYNLTDFKIAPLYESRRIAYKLSEFRNILKTQVCLLQLPYERPETDLLTYAHVASWDSLLGDYRFAANNLQGINYVVSEAFRKIRSIAFTDICIETNFLGLDKWNWISGELVFVTPKLSVDKLEVMIKLKAIYDKERNEIWNDEDIPPGETRKALFIMSQLNSSRLNKTKILFKLPESFDEKKSMHYLKIEITPDYIETYHGKEYLSFKFKNKCERINSLTAN